MRTLTLCCAVAASTGCPTNDTGSSSDACDELPAGEVDFAADESVHQELLEWWYWTGHLQDDQGRWYGFEQTFFVFQMGFYDATMAHVAVTDIDAGTFSYDYTHIEELPDPEMSGIDLVAGTSTAQGLDGHDRLAGATDRYAIDLELEASKAPVLHHGDGFHEYEVGGYTWYYTRPRMDVTGTITVDGEPRAVSGQGWMDHQWGNLLLIAETGWDWFAVQLDDGREIMIFLVRDEDEVPGGSITGPDCVTEELGEDEIEVTAQGTWTSPISGCSYPMGWDVRVRDMHFTVTPVMEDQELYHERETYWEGASIVDGDVSGRAYVELAGYCASADTD